MLLYHGKQRHMQYLFISRSLHVIITCQENYFELFLHVCNVFVDEGTGEPKSVLLHDTPVCTQLFLLGTFFNAPDSAGTTYSITLLQPGCLWPFNYRVQDALPRYPPSSDSVSPVSGTCKRGRQKGVSLICSDLF